MNALSKLMDPKHDRQPATSPGEEVVPPKTGV